MKPIYCISDLHLSADHPALLSLFEAFIQHIHQNCSALYILGDWFAYWGNTRPERDFFHTVGEALLPLRRAQVPIYFIPGNRDLLLDAPLLARYQVSLLPDPYFLTVGAIQYCFTHGDKYITEDKHYRYYRLIAQNRFTKFLLRALPEAVRAFIVRTVRNKSEASRKTQKRYYDVDPKALLQAVAGTKATVVIHGHTHIPMVKPLNDSVTKVVMAEWGTVGSFVKIEEKGWGLEEYRS